MFACAELEVFRELRKQSYFKLRFGTADDLARGDNSNLIMQGWPRWQHQDVVGLKSRKMFKTTLVIRVKVDCCPVFVAQAMEHGGKLAESNAIPSFK
jgi:hypothetical protein